MTLKRIGALDAARGLAVVAMVIFHLSWDLSWFGYVDWNVNGGANWRAFAATIASSFLFLSGVSFELSHANGIRWHSFIKRFAILALAAGAISLATYFSFGQSYVRFGILHCLAVSSLICLLAHRFPDALLVLLGLCIVGLRVWMTSPYFDGQLMLWTGLGTPTYSAVDYVPLAPWAAFPIFGMAFTRMARVYFDADTPREPKPPKRFMTTLAWLGRHSLIIYLVHQPVLFGITWAGSQLGLSTDHRVTRFINSCTSSCAASGENEAQCKQVCSCTMDAITESGDWQILVNDPNNEDARAGLNSSYSECLWPQSEPQTQPEAQTPAQTPANPAAQN